MRRQDLPELHYITPIANLASIVRRGILSNARAQAVPHSSVAKQEVQDRRDGVCIPGGRPLHEYVNLYICARNPMLFLRKDQHEALCVVRVSTDVLDLPGVVVASGNASSLYVRFGPGPRGLELVDEDLVFAEYWTDQDAIVYYQKKSAKCAEVLIPDVIAPEYLVGVYVSGKAGVAACEAAGSPLETSIDEHLFFT